MRFQIIHVQYQLLLKSGGECFLILIYLDIRIVISIYYV